MTYKELDFKQSRFGNAFDRNQPKIIFFLNSGDDVRQKKREKTGRVHF